MMKADKIAKVTLVMYSLSLTAVTVLALTIGPFKESVPLWLKLRSIEAELGESRRQQKTWEEERAKLLGAMKSLQADRTAQQETIRVLREAVKDPNLEQKLIEANRLVERLERERSVLIVKLDELQKQIKLLAGGTEEKK